MPLRERDHLYLMEEVVVVDKALLVCVYVQAHIYVFVCVCGCVCREVRIQWDIHHCSKSWELELTIKLGAV